MTALIEFETDRLRLRQWRPADREPFAALNADPRVMECFPACLDRAASDALADTCQALIAGQGWGPWAVERRDNGAFVGLVGLKAAPAALPFSPCIEIAWRLAFEAWGQGYASEAARGALRVGFEQLGLPEIVAFTAVVNGRSQRVMERLGMARAPETFSHPAVPAGSPLVEHCLYRFSRQCWQQGAG